MIGEVKKFFNEHLDFGIYSTTIISMLTALAVLPCMYFLPEKCGFEKIDELMNYGGDTDNIFVKEIS